MGNLGHYQLITTIAKKVGGPKNLIGIVAIGGYTVGKGIEVSAKKAYKTIRGKLVKASKIAEKDAVEYSVEKFGKSNEGLEFKVGDKFKVINQDGDAILIDKVDDTNSPYFVSAKFLRTISRFD